MSAPKHDEPTKLSQDLLESLHGVFGVHSGHRPVHAKGLMFSGVFTPSAEAASLTRSPHARQSSTPVTVRFSNFAGIPSIADNDPNGASPRGIAIRFHLGEHVHTDIVAHSHKNFPVRTGEEFVELLHAIAAAKSATPNPGALDNFFASHPAARDYLTTPAEFPTSFATEKYFAVTAFKFTNEAGESCFGRFRIVPANGTEYLSDDEASTKSPNFLVDEISERVSRGDVRMRLLVQVADSGDTVDDSTVVWPETRRLVELGTFTLAEQVADEEPEHRRIIFDPVPRVDGIDLSGDPLTMARSGVYLLSGRNRRTEDQQKTTTSASAAPPA